MIVIYITYPNKEEAKKIVGKLLQSKLIACATIFPVKSMYIWKGEPKNEKEYVSLLKAPAENWKKITNMILKLHSYEIPCIIRLESQSTLEYNSWVDSIGR